MAQALAHSLPCLQIQRQDSLLVKEACSYNASLSINKGLVYYSTRTLSYSSPSHGIHPYITANDM